MKLSLSALILTVAAVSTSQARSLIRETTEILPRVEVNGVQTNLTGRLTMNYFEATIHLEILNDSCHQLTAQAGQVTCLAMPQVVAEFEVPLQNREESCGSYMFSGIADHRPVDGPRQEIYVTDNSRRTCEDMIQSLLVVHAKSVSPRGNLETNYTLMK